MRAWTIWILWLVAILLVVGLGIGMICEALHTGPIAAFLAGSIAGGIAAHLYIRWYDFP